MVLRHRLFSGLGDSQKLSVDHFVHNITNCFFTLPIFWRGEAHAPFIPVTPKLGFRDKEGRKEIKESKVIKGIISG